MRIQSAMPATDDAETPIAGWPEPKLPEQVPSHHLQPKEHLRRCALARNLPSADELWHHDGGVARRGQNPSNDHLTTSGTGFCRYRRRSS